jgi:AcrR family transcriptional regulator
MHILVGMSTVADPPPARRTREEQRQETRRRLLDAAAQVFAERGYHAASVDEVAEAAGMTKGAVYSNFSSKEELFLALLDDRMSPYLRGYQAVFDARPDPGAGIDSLDSAYASLLEGDRTWWLLRAEFWLHAMRNPEARYKMAARQRLLRDALAGVLDRQAQGLGVEPAMRPSELASVVLALTEGLSSQRMVDPDAVPEGLVTDALPMLLGVLLGGIPARSRGTAPASPAEPPG